MSISSELKKKWASLSDSDKDRIVRMAWEDRSTFEDIESQFGLSPNDVERFMRTQLDAKDYKRWRRRANTQGQLKHKSKRPADADRFKCTRQSVDGVTKGWK